jgi:adenosine deaminase
MHLEGSLEPELLLDLAQRNAVALPWATASELRAAYQFSNLQSFLDLYYAGCRVLVTEQDFYDLTRAYLRRAVTDGVIRAEMFIGPQSFTTNGVPIEFVMNGVLNAIADSDEISAGLIITAQRHRTEADAFALLEQLRPWQDQLLGIGMGGAEVGNPPSKFVQFFRACRHEGLRITIHAGEEGPAAYVREAVELLGVDRIDHGIACLEDADLVRELAAARLPLTVCPLSNVQLKVVSSIEDHPLRQLMQAGLHVTVNSDDPAYFGGYATENLVACVLPLTEMLMVVRNGFEAAFMSDVERQAALDRLDAYVAVADRQ